MSLRIQMLTERQCRIARKVVDDMADVWISRHPAMQFYTLGMATYLDSQEEYRAKKNEYNEYLNGNFSWLYSIVMASLEDIIGECRLEEDLAFPGFHIVGHKPGVDNSDATINLMKKVQTSTAHIDGVLEPNLDVLEDKYSQVVKDSLTSVTVPIEIPGGGAGICIWNDENWAADEGFAHSIQSLYRNNKYGIPTVQEYVEGQGFIFLGDTLHQMAPAIDPTPEDRRITLQAHAVLCDDIWRLFF